MIIDQLDSDDCPAGRWSRRTVTIVEDLADCRWDEAIPAATAVGISQPGLSRIEKGKTVPDPEIVEALARIYGTDPDETARLVELATAIRPEHLDSRIIMQRGLNHFQARLGKIEQSSALIRAYQPNIILGILQTSPMRR